MKQYNFPLQARDEKEEIVVRVKKIYYHKDFLLSLSKRFTHAPNQLVISIAPPWLVVEHNILGVKHESSNKEEILILQLIISF